MFAERGFAGTQMEEIARRCATSVGAIYLLFESKEALCLSFLSEAADAFGAQWARMAHEASTAENPFGSLITVSANVLERRPELLRSIVLLSEPTVRKTAARQLAFAAAKTWLTACQEILRADLPLDESPDRDLRSEQLGTSLLGVFVAEVSRRNLGGTPRPLERLFADAVAEQIKAWDRRG